MKTIKISNQKVISVVPDKDYSGVRDKNLLRDLISNATHPVHEDGVFIIDYSDHWLYGYAYKLIKIC